MPVTLNPEQIKDLHDAVSQSFPDHSFIELAYLNRLFLDECQKQIRSFETLKQNVLPIFFRRTVLGAIKKTFPNLDQKLRDTPEKVEQLVAFFVSLDIPLDSTEAGLARTLSTDSEFYKPLIEEVLSASEANKQPVILQNPVAVVGEDIKPSAIDAILADLVTKIILRIRSIFLNNPASERFQALIQKIKQACVENNISAEEISLMPPTKKLCVLITKLLKEEDEVQLDIQAEFSLLIKAHPELVLATDENKVLASSRGINAIAAVLLSHNAIAKTPPLFQDAEAYQCLFAQYKEEIVAHYNDDDITDAIMDLVAKLPYPAPPGDCILFDQWCAQVKKPFAYVQVDSKEFQKIFLAHAIDVKPTDITSCAILTAIVAEFWPQAADQYRFAQCIVDCFFLDITRAIDDKRLRALIENNKMLIEHKVWEYEYPENQELFNEVNEAPRQKRKKPHQAENPKLKTTLVKTTMAPATAATAATPQVIMSSQAAAGWDFLKQEHSGLFAGTDVNPLQENNSHPVETTTSTTPAVQITVLPSAADNSSADSFQKQRFNEQLHAYARVNHLVAHGGHILIFLLKIVEAHSLRNQKDFSAQLADEVCEKENDSIARCANFKQALKNYLAAKGLKTKHADFGWLSFCIEEAHQKKDFSTFQQALADQVYTKQLHQLNGEQEQNICSDTEYFNVGAALMG